MKFISLTTTTLLALGAVAADSALEVLGRSNATEAAHTLASGKIYRVVGVDIVGSNLRDLKIGSPSECWGSCAFDMTPGRVCSGSTWTPYQGGTCWHKYSNEAQAPPTAPNTEAESFFAVSNVASSVIWSQRKDGFDMAGNDLTNSRANDMGACMAACNANDKCFAVTWTNYNGGTCWLKSRASNYVPYAGGMTAYVARAYTM